MVFAAIGALLGLIFGGPVGLLVGAVTGYIAGIALARSVIGGLRVAQTNLMDSTNMTMFELAHHLSFPQETLDLMLRGSFACQ